MVLVIFGGVVIMISCFSEMRDLKKKNMSMKSKISFGW